MSPTRRAIIPPTPGRRRTPARDYPRGHRDTSTAINVHVTIRTKEPEVPAEFPPARLFLNDIEEIVRVLIAATENYHREREHGGAQTKVTLRIGDQICDEVEELPKIAAKTKELGISVEKGDWADSSLTIGKTHTLLLCFRFARHESLNLYHKLAPIFKRRNLRWRTFVHSAPWLISAYGFLALPLFALLQFLLKQAMPPTPAYALSAALVASLLIALIMGLFLHTTVILRHSSEPSAVRQGLRDKLPAALLGAVLGSVITFVLTLVGLYLKHKYWP
jgi:hypothetical protein